MAPRRRTVFDDRGVLIEDGRHLPFFSGAMHYWRVEPSAWAACLRAIKQVGLTTVETYVPWRVHDKHAFTGRLDLGTFIDRAADAGLAVVLRPGPHINAELTGFGFPDRILTNPAIQARTARDTPAFMPAPPRAFPIPSYASSAFHTEVHAWYATVADIVHPRLAPDGPVIALGVDNEAQQFFRLGAFDLDYHPDALAWWHLDHTADPPRDASDPSLAAEWVRFKDVYLARALGLFASYLDDLEIARVHNLPPTEPFHYDLPRISTAISGPVGIDVYSARADFPAARRRALHAVGSASPLPLALECGVGFFPWFPPIDRDNDPDRSRDQLLTLLAAGIRGFNLFMAVERDRYYGAAIDKRGTVEATWVQPLMTALSSVDWPSLRRTTPIALVASRADLRFGTATSPLDPMTPIVLEALGLREVSLDSAAVEHRRWFAAIESALDLARVPYAIVDETNPDLSPYRAVIVPTFDRMDASLLAALRTTTARVVIGPGTPTRDELDRPITFDLRRIGRIRPGSLADLPSLAADLAALAGDLPTDYTVETPDVISSVFSSADSPRVVFIQSFADQSLTAALVASQPLRDAFTNETFTPAAGGATIPLRPRGIRMLLIE